MLRLKTTALLLLMTIGPVSLLSACTGEQAADTPALAVSGMSEKDRAETLLKQAADKMSRVTSFEATVRAKGSSGPTTEQIMIQHIDKQEMSIYMDAGKGKQSLMRFSNGMAETYNTFPYDQWSKKSETRFDPVQTNVHLDKPAFDLRQTIQLDGLQDLAVNEDQQHVTITGKTPSVSSSFVGATGKQNQMSAEANFQIVLSKDTGYLSGMVVDSNSAVNGNARNIHMELTVSHINSASPIMTLEDVRTKLSIEEAEAQQARAAASASLPKWQPDVRYPKTAADGAVIHQEKHPSGTKFVYVTGKRWEYRATLRPKADGTHTHSHYILYPLVLGEKVAWKDVKVYISKDNRFDDQTPYWSPPDEYFDGRLMEGVGMPMEKLESYPDVAPVLYCKVVYDIEVTRTEDQTTHRETGEETLIFKKEYMDEM
ncbi:hypothetical protein SK3146_01616 [Paenibacillus konkukensis]|uniref:Lipoprotein n=1 Tax=Paenibacillus konkukensis TaxID=2020716 RepID=A0ABY4RLC6_9BACL|nr:hypothetical protein [Paenibacillus konkukensis]UQZ82459.1 hypothetical protein SK3146_01616 [Paenibacillus konkukensis]